MLRYILAPNSCARTRNRAKSTIPGIFQQSLLASHRFLTEHPELRKDRRRLFVQIKDNNAGKELSAATISRWICTNIVNSHAIQNSKSFSGSLDSGFNKVDPPSVLKTGRWSSGGTFTSFYLRDLWPQAYSLRRTGPLVAAGNIVVISSS